MSTEKDRAAAREAVKEAVKTAEDNCKQHRRDYDESTKNKGK